MDNNCKFEKPVKRSNRCSVRGCKVAEVNYLLFCGVKIISESIESGI